MVKKFFLRYFLGGLLLVSANSWSMMCSSDPNTPVPDNSINGGASDVNPGDPASITIDVPLGAVGTITDLDFQLVMNSTWVGDLTVTLTSPSGTIVTLLNRPGRADNGSGAGGFGCGRDNIDVTFDDSATTAAEGECNVAVPTISGSVSPTGNLSDFNGEPLSGTWTITAVDFFPLDPGTFISASTCLSATTNPVTVSSVKTRQRGKNLVFKWQTASEAFNLGFHLWGNVDGDWLQLNNRLIPARNGDSLTPVDYRKRVNVVNLPGEVTQVGLSALSTSGQEDFYGPFAIGEEYGEQAVPKKVDWVAQRSAYDAARAAAGYIKVNNRWVFNTDKRIKRQNLLEQRYQDIVLSVADSGVYRVSYEALLEKGFDLSNMPVNRLAITRNGVPVPRIVKTKNQSKRVGGGSEIIFYATGPSKETERYVDNVRYRISFDSSKVLNADSVEVNEHLVLGSVSVSDTHTKVINFGEKNTYLFALPGETPWYDTGLRAFGQTASHLIDLDIPITADLSGQAQLLISVVGGLEFALIDADGDGDLEPNHHYQVYVNRDRFQEPVYEGFSNGLDSLDISADIKGRLVHGRNTVELALIPDNGYGVDAAFYIGGSLNYTEKSIFDSNALSFEVDRSGSALSVIDADKEVTAVYRFDRNGNFVQLGFDHVDDRVLLNSPHNPSLEKDAGLGVWLAGEQGYLTPNDVWAPLQVDDQVLSLEGIDYVVIADSSLVGDDLQRFADGQLELGRKTKVVSADDIFNYYADGLVIPQAISDYLADQSQTSEFKYVLLVGGHTYNYRGYNVVDDQQPINMIPSFYRAADFLSKQIPTAVPFVDFDQDGLPDRAIGRWPVRDLAQLKNVVDKTLLWHAQDSHKDSKTSLFIADTQDSFNDFALSSDQLIPELGLPSAPWEAPTKVYSDLIALDDSVVNDQKLEFNRNALVNAVNQGPALTVFSGHGAPVSWGAQRLLNASVAERFANDQAPSLIIPLACYTTYYETPEVKSLSELLLTDSANGAVALSGAALLSSTLDNENFAQGLLRDMTVSGSDLGTAVLKMKRRMKNAGSGRAALVYNWVTLGDPTLSFGLPDVTPEINVEEPVQDRR